MAEFTFEIEEKLLVLSENDKGWTTAKWARELHFPMKNSKFSWMHLKTDRESSISFFYFSEK